MGYIKGSSRSEVLLFPEALDDYITEENPVRFIDAFVASLDLGELGFTRAVPASTAGPLELNFRHTPPQAASARQSLEG